MITLTKTIIAKIIKLKEIYETFDGALDRCADVADVVEDVALKYGNGWVDYG